MKKLLLVIVVVVLLAGGWLLLWSRGAGSPQQSADGSSARSPSAATSHVDDALKRMSLRDKVASLFVLHAAGTNATALGKFIDRYQPGGFILMGDNIPDSDDKLRTLTSALRGSDNALPRLVAIDQEGGTVRRLKGDGFPAAGMLRSRPADATRQAYADRSALVRSVGVTLNFGIVADVTGDPASFIYPRVLGTTPDAAAARVAAAVRGTDGKTLSTLKHFPGHGETAADSHHTIPTTSIGYSSWLTRDAPSFEAGIAAGADVVMMGHLRYSAIDDQPASLSKKWHDILRDNLHFGGVIITDDMCMLQNSGIAAYHDPVSNAIAALNADNTLLLYVLDNADSASTKIDPDALIDGVVAAVKSGKVRQSLIDHDVRQALELRAQAAEYVMTKSAK